MTAEIGLQEEWELTRVDRVTLARDLVISDCLCPGGEGLLFYPTDLVVTPDSTTAYATFRLAGEELPGGEFATGSTVIAVDLASETRTLLTLDLSNPLGIVFDAQGDLLVAQRAIVSEDPLVREGQIVRLDPDLPDPPPVLVSAGGLRNVPRGLTVYMPDPRAAISQAAGLLALAALARRRQRADSSWRSAVSNSARRSRSACSGSMPAR